MKASLLPLALAALLCMLQTVQAATYVVSRTLSTGTVVGTVETDGTLGQLGTVNVIHYSLVFTAPGLPGGSVLLEANDGGSFFIQGDSVTATSDGLLFDFDNPSPNLIVFRSDPDAGDTIWCLVTNDDCADQGPYRETLAYLDSEWTEIGSTPQTGQVTFATTGLTSVPVPPGLFLMAAGMLALSALRRQTP